MTKPLILASGSEIRRQLLGNAAVPFSVITADVDEKTIKDRLTGQGANPEMIALALAKAKALSVSDSALGSLVLGCDQVLSFEGQLFSKPKTAEDAKAQLIQLSGKTHHLITAATAFENGKSIWSHVGSVALHMHELTDSFIRGYVSRNWPGVSYCVGSYKLEEEGARLFQKVDGDYFHVLGLPLFEILDMLTQKGVIER